MGIIDKIPWGYMGIYGDIWEYDIFSDYGDMGFLINH
jgi:hypothetical protein